MTRIIAVLNQKGGVGKTTTVANLGAALARRGQRVLLLDLDPQANLTVHVGLEPRQPDNSTYSLLLGEHDLESAIQDTGVPGLRIVPSTLALANAEIQLASAVGRELILREVLETWLDPMPAFGGGETPAAGQADFILIDCPPSLGIITMNALCSATDVLLPIQAEFFALQGVAGLLESLKAVQRLNRRARLSLVVPCMVDLRTNLARDVVQEVRQYFGSLVSGTLIRKNVALAEAPSHGKTIFEYAPSSRGAKDYDSLASEILGERVAPYDITPKTRGMVYDDSSPESDETGDADAEQASAAAESPEPETATEPEVPSAPEVVAELDSAALVVTEEKLDEPATVAVATEEIGQLLPERAQLQETGPESEEPSGTEDLTVAMDEMHARLHEALGAMLDDDDHADDVSEPPADDTGTAEPAIEAAPTSDELPEGTAWIAAASDAEAAMVAPSDAESEAELAETIPPNRLASADEEAAPVSAEPEPTDTPAECEVETKPEPRLRLVEDADGREETATVAAAAGSERNEDTKRDDEPKRSVWTRWLGL